MLQSYFEIPAETGLRPTWSFVKAHSLRLPALLLAGQALCPLLALDNLQRKSNVPRTVPHFEQVDQQRIIAQFSACGRHRLSLTLPFKDRNGKSMVCALGQNPSYANQTICDKTIRYIEQLVYHRFPDAGGVEILNLYSRIDTKKTHKTDLLSLAAARETRRKIQQYDDFLIFTGKNKKQKTYNFPKRAMQLRRLLRGKRVWKIEIGTDYAPHPGNQRITYIDLTHPVGPYMFADLDS